MKLNFEKLLEESKQIDYKALAIKASAAQDTWFEYAPTWKYGKCDEKRNKKFGYFEHLYRAMKLSFVLFIHAFVPDLFPDYASKELNDNKKITLHL